MKITVWTAITIWAAVAMYWLDGHAPWAPWWVKVGLGCGTGSALHLLIMSIREARPPKQPKKSFPTTPR